MVTLMVPEVVWPGVREYLEAGGLEVDPVPHTPTGEYFTLTIPTDLVLQAILQLAVKQIREGD